jgi:hypothetical protein
MEYPLGVLGLMAIPGGTEMSVAKQQRYAVGLEVQKPAHFAKDC